MSYNDFYLKASEVAEMIRNGTYDSKRQSAKARRESAGIVKRPARRRSREDTETVGGSFFGGFSSALNSMSEGGGGIFGRKPAAIETDGPTGSVDVDGDDFPTFTAKMMAVAGPQINTRQNRAANGERTPEDVETDRQEEMRQDFRAHRERGGTVQDFDFVKYQYGDNTIRNKPVSSALLEDMSFLKDMGIQMVVYSGGQDAKGHGDRRTGSTRHDDGNAADAYFIDMKTGEILDWSKPENKAIFQEIFYRGYQNGVQGWGAHAEYMGTKSVHLGYGNPAVWGKGGTGRPAGWLWEAWNNAQSGRVPERFAKAAEETRGLMDKPTSSNAPSSIIQSESSGRWDAENEVAGAGGKGHFGRVQFSRARLQEAKDAGAIPADMTPEQFMKDPEAQVSAENWHFADIEDFIKKRGLDKYIGQKIKGIPVTMQGMVAAAHLGGQTGLYRFITSGGTYDPSDAYGTSLSDYLKKHMA